jgi:hypothetical protein
MVEQPCLQCGVYREVDVIEVEEQIDTVTENDVEGDPYYSCRFEARSTIYRCRVCGTAFQRLPTLTAYWAVAPLHHAPKHNDAPIII